jgi:hypothetical protein
MYVKLRRTITCMRGSFKNYVKDIASIRKHTIFGQLLSQNPSTDEDGILHG